MWIYKALKNNNKKRLTSVQYSTEENHLSSNQIIKKAFKEKFNWPQKKLYQPKTLRCISDFTDTLTATARATPTAAGWVWWTWRRGRRGRTGRGRWRWRGWTGRGRRGRSTTASFPLLFLSSWTNRREKYKRKPSVVLWLLLRCLRICWHLNYLQILL